jgi:replicative DNA helicase
MVQPASEIVLSEVDVEISLLGSLFTAPAAFDVAADQIQPDWFSDPFCRYLFDAAMKLRSDGHRISPQAIVAMLPEDCGGLPRGTFYARVCANGMTPNFISGLVHTLKDRWARRILLIHSDEIKSRATLFSENPYALADDAIIYLNTVSSARGERRGKSFDDSMRQLRESRSDTVRLRGATTGLFALDNKLNGYVRGQLYVIAGRPGMGKSAFMCSSLRRTAQSGKGVGIFSLEMTAEEIAARCLSDALDSVHAPFFGNILKGQTSDAESADLLMAEESMSGLPLEVDDSPRLTFAEIAGKARALKAKMAAIGIELSVVCVDHMGLVTPSDRYRGNKVAEAGEVSGQARALAKELDCCVVLLCQLSREVEKRDDKRPVMSDLRWSGEIEQDAHVIGFLYREAYYLAQNADADPFKVRDAQHQIDFLIRKNRNGETADIKFWCSIGHSSIRDN